MVESAAGLQVQNMTEVVVVAGAEDEAAPLTLATNDDDGGVSNHSGGVGVGVGDGDGVGVGVGAGMSQRSAESCSTAIEALVRSEVLSFL